MKFVYQRTDHVNWWDSNKYKFTLKGSDQFFCPTMAKLIRTINE